MCRVYRVCGNGNSQDIEFPFLSNFIKRTKPSEYTAIGISYYTHDYKLK